MEKILIVDDAPINRGILSEIFNEQYEVLEAADGEAACEIIDRLGKEIDLIFLDYMMPKKNGLEVLAHMRLNDMLDNIPVIMITGEATVESDVKAYEYGAADIIYKPFSTQVVMRRAQNLMELYKSREKTEEELEKRTEELKESKRALENTNDFLLDALGSVVEFRSLESGVHVQRVKEFTRIILQYVMSFYPEYGLDSRTIDMISRASALHDVGKIAISDEILNAPRKLTTAEFAEMKKHTTHGCEILERFRFQDDEFFEYCYDICRWHHEKVDGKGYPDGLKGDEIPIYCQAVSLADCFDALISERVYKGPVRAIDAYNMIQRGECGAFSDMLLEIFAKARLELFIAAEREGLGV